MGSIGGIRWDQVGSGGTRWDVPPPKVLRIHSGFQVGGGMKKDVKVYRYGTY